MRVAPRRPTIVGMRWIPGGRMVVVLVALPGLLGLGACDPDEMLGKLLGGNPRADADPEARIDEMARALGLEATGDGGYAYRSGDLTATVAADGTVDFEGAAEPGFAGPADWRLRGDPRSASAKRQLELLQATADLRREMSLLWFDDVVDRSIETLDAELVSIIESPHLSMRQRRAMIFERWDSVDEVFEGYAATTAESAVVDIDRLREDAARRVRARIEAFVRRHLPAGTPDAFRNDELEQLNAGRRAARPFDPYEGEAVMG